MSADSNLQHGFSAKLLYPHNGPSTSAQRMTALPHLPRSHLLPHGRTLGVAPFTSTSRTIPPTTNPSRTQSSACHQSS